MSVNRGMYSDIESDTYDRARDKTIEEAGKLLEIETEREANFVERKNIHFPDDADI